jgi:NAD(P)H-flavin reductase
MANPVKVRAEVKSITRHGSGVYAVMLSPKSALPRFKAGQFLHLTIDEYDPAGGFWPESRVFSIASAPGSQDLEIVYSVKGKYTHRMEAALCAGREVWLKLPYGSFTIDAAIKPDQDVVLIAGGTGISPYLSYLEQLQSSKKTARRIRLYYGIRENDMVLAVELLDACCSAGLLECFLYVENEDPDGRLPKASANRSGRLQCESIFLESSDLSKPVFFLSGPPGMIALFKRELISASIDPERIKIDEWE